MIRPGSGNTASRSRRGGVNPPSDILSAALAGGGAIGAAAALAGLGVGLAILIANPAGAALAALIIGGIGAGTFLYKLGRWAWKSWKTKDLGQKRKSMASLLLNEIRAHDALALDVVRSLHLDPALIAADPNGADKIARKLKSV